MTSTCGFFKIKNDGRDRNGKNEDVCVRIDVYTSIFGKSSQLIGRAYGQSSFEVLGNRALIQLSSRLSHRHKLLVSNFQKPSCCAHRGRQGRASGQGSGRATGERGRGRGGKKEEDIRRSYRLRLIIHGAWRALEWTQRCGDGVGFPR